jgi:hypothetical protein
MNKLTLSLVLSLCALCGCAHNYVVKMTNGQQMTVSSKPKLKGGNYYYKDAKGQMHTVPQGRVTEIENADIAKEENKPFAPHQPYKKKHWYWPF